MNEAENPSKSSNLSGAERIKRLRQHLNFSLRELAEEFQVTHGAVALWESGERPIQGPVLRLLEIYEQDLGLKNEGTSSGFEEIDQIVTSRFGRGLAISQFASKAFSYWLVHLIKSRVQTNKNYSSFKKKSFIKMTDDLVKRLSEMKGLPMKLGQTLSYHNFSMPSEAQEIFERLQTQSAFLNPKVVSGIVRDELGQNPKSLFSKWSTKPFSAASIGQVHFAKIPSGEKVAVKIQYPGISRSIRTDLKNLNAFLKFFKNLAGPTDLNSIMQELSDRLLDECDYQTESQTQEFFRDFFKDRKEIVIPRVFVDYSTKNILCTEFVEGQSFQEFLRTSSQEEKNQMGRIIWRFSFESIFITGALNADPHPGNYLFQKDAVVFLDFGCSKKLSPNFVRGWRNILFASITQDEEKLIQAVRDLGMLIPGPSIDVEQLRLIAESIYEPYLKNENYVFNGDYVQKSFKAWFGSERSRQNFIFQSEWLSLTRILFGLSSILASLKAEANWLQELMSILERSPFRDEKYEGTTFLPGNRSEPLLPGKALGGDLRSQSKQKSNF